MTQINYYGKYRSLIWNRNRNPLPENVYGEKHHILPKAIWPEHANNPKNIIKLTAAEHFRAHWYLVKHFEEIGDTEKYRKMLYASIIMGKKLINGSTHITDSELFQISEEYQEIREKFSKMMSEKRKGKPLSEEHKRNISLGMIGHPVSALTRSKMAMAKVGVKRPYLKFRTRSDKGTHRSPEVRQRMSEAKKKFWAERKKVAKNPKNSESVL